MPDVGWISCLAGSVHVCGGEGTLILCFLLSQSLLLLLCVYLPFVFDVLDTIILMLVCLSFMICLPSHTGF
ncbi:hypothetical protein F5H01DRAFT_332453 [Linnemannia elongata]|nr:hypothetical protein F5H01DRAFT_332453 [Linnemannia elongata]